MLLQNGLNEKDKGKIVYEIWQLTGKEEFRIKAIEIYEFMPAIRLSPIKK